MKRLMSILLSVVVLIVVGVIGLGFYQGWFGLSADSAGGKSSVALTVDQDKINQDAHQAKEQVQELAHDVKDKAAAATEKAPEKK